MYLSAERLALANQTIKETFEQCSIAWQAIPHWDTRDPGQIRVPNDVVDKPDFLELEAESEKFELTLVQANAPSPDSLLAEVISKTADLAKTVDGIVLKALSGKAKTEPLTTPPPPDPLLDILNTLIKARADIEDVGYRAPSCLFTNTDGLIAISPLVSGLPQMGPVLTAASVNSLHRATTIDPNLAAGKKLFLMLGRRQLIAHRGAAQASPGEESVDLAVSVLPSLEVVGEGQNGGIEVSVRIRFVTRIKDASALVAVVDP
ncbi:MAG: hypothetical protein QOH91_2147 [Mycobacterium sp.]|jgi:hypothetical protein|nr:hypothetical protein [Mycobacterium sp.]